MNHYSEGGYIKTDRPMRIKAYNHGDHRSLTPTHLDKYGQVVCDRIFTREEVDRWYTKNRDAIFGTLRE